MSEKSLISNSKLKSYYHLMRIMIKVDSFTMISKKFEYDIKIVKHLNHLTDYALRNGPDNIPYISMCTEQYTSTLSFRWKLGLNIRNDILKSLIEKKLINRLSKKYKKKIFFLPFLFIIIKQNDKYSNLEDQYNDDIIKIVEITINNYSNWYIRDPIIKNDRGNIIKINMIEEINFDKNTNVNFIIALHDIKNKFNPMDWTFIKFMCGDDDILTIRFLDWIEKTSNWNLFKYLFIDKQN